VKVEQVKRKLDRNALEDFDKYQNRLKKEQQRMTNYKKKMEG